MQLAFAETDRAVAEDERLAELLGQARCWSSTDPLRCIFFAHEALLTAQELDRPEDELTALMLLMEGLYADRRTSDMVPFIARAIELAERSAELAKFDALLSLLGNWAVEQEQDPPASRVNRAIDLPWLPGAIARLEAVRASRTARPDLSLVPDGPGERHRFGIEVYDHQTGLLNARGLTLELIRLEDENESAALIQIAVTEHNPDLIVDLATVVGQEIAQHGIVTRNSHLTLTVVLPGTTGMAALRHAQDLRHAILRMLGGHPVPVGIGVAVKQHGDSSRDLLRRLVDRRDEALQSGGVAVVG